MGNRHSRRGVYKYEEEPTIFDVMGLLVDFKWSFPPKLPACLDELVDWAHEATVSLRLLNEHGFHNDHPTEFISFINRGILHTQAEDCSDTQSPGQIEQFDSFASQKDVICFPQSGGFIDLAKFYQNNVVVLVLFPDQPPCSALPVVRFAEYVTLCRRLVELLYLGGSNKRSYKNDSDPPASNSDLEHDPECAICMQNANQTVLPCMHSLCSECEAKWVDSHADCPFCRKRFGGRHKRKSQQWHLETWSGDVVVDDIASLSRKLTSLLQTYSIQVEQDVVSESYVQLQKSLHEEMVDDDFVLLLS